MRAPTGRQVTIRRELAAGAATATITELAAGIRQFRIAGIDLVESFGELESPPAACGIVLVPWPNRVEHGLWHLDGVPQQLDLTVPGRGQATHGLLRNAPYAVVEHLEHAVTLAATVFPQHGYPFHLETLVRYELVDGGLRVTHEIDNVGDAAAPVAIGTHPYLRLGDIPIEHLTLTVDAGTRFELDDRLIPTRELPVDGDFDLAAGRRVGDLDLNVTFGGVRSTGGLARHRLAAPDGSAVELWQDENFGYVQVFTPRAFPRGGVEGLAIAIEPMTAPPNALATGQSLHWLEVGGHWSASWGIDYTESGERE